MPQVTVAIPFYNNVTTLGSAVASVLAQSEPDIELLLVDDGSTDGSRDVAEAHHDDDRVRIISDGENLGLVSRLNQIATLAEGHYLARMDADDICHPVRIASQLRYLAEHPAVDVVATGAWIIDEHNNVVGRRQCHPLAAGRRVPLTRGPLLHPTVLARTDWFRRHPYNESYPRAEDKELWCRTWTSSTFAQIPEPLLFYRVGRTLPMPNYRQGCQSDRRILARYGPALVGRRQTVLMLAEAFAVEAATIAADRLGLAKTVLEYRDRKVAPSVASEAEQVLASLLREK